jgi:hypothetical protein
MSEQINGEQLFNDIMESRRPVFEVFAPDSDRHYKIYLNGDIDGFGDGQERLVRANYLGALIRSIEARGYSSSTQRSSSEPTSTTTEAASGLEQGSPP